MKNSEQIRIIENLIQAVECLSVGFEDDQIQEGESLVNYLKSIDNE